MSVIPLARGIFHDDLTYFSAKPLAPGAVVTVPVRKRAIPAVVVACKPAQAEKTALRRASYALKKVGRLQTPGLVRPGFISAAEKTAEYAAQPLGSVLPALISQSLVVNLGALESAAPGNEQPPTGLRPDLQALQNQDDERWSTYKSIVREEFARTQSVLLIVPTHLDALRVAETLSRGITDFTFILHGKLSKKALIESWNGALKETRPVLIITTPAFAGLPRHDLKTFIVERENSPSYKMLARPFVDWRRFLEQLAAATGARVLYGDSALRVETLWRLERGELMPAESVKQRLVTTAENFLITSKSGEPLAPETLELIRAGLAASEHLFILAGRRGLAPLVVCDDCGEPVLCARCQGPVALHERKAAPEQDARYFLCHRCGQERSAKEKCQTCESWRLRELGIGIGRISQRLQEVFPEAHIVTVESDTQNTPKRTRDQMRNFSQAASGILVGTELALHYLLTPIDTAIIVAADSLLALPDFRIHERLYSLAARVRSLARKNFAIQTRYPEEPVFNYALAGNTIEFYRHELADRESFDYPPFKTLIKITRGGSRAVVREDMKRLAAHLNTFQPQIYPSFQEPGSDNYRLQALIRLPPERWPNPTLVSFLKSLPPSFIVNVDPADIL